MSVLSARGHRGPRPLRKLNPKKSWHIRMPHNLQKYGEQEGCEIPLWNLGTNPPTRTSQESSASQADGAKSPVDPRLTLFVTQRTIPGETVKPSRVSPASFLYHMLWLLSVCKSASLPEPRGVCSVKDHLRRLRTTLQAQKSGTTVVVQTDAKDGKRLRRLITHRLKAQLKNRATLCFKEMEVNDEGEQECGETHLWIPIQLKADYPAGPDGLILILSDDIHLSKHILKKMSVHTICTDLGVTISKLPGSLHSVSYALKTPETLKTLAYLSTHLSSSEHLQENCDDGVPQYSVPSATLRCFFSNVKMNS
ncbi:hypothetical protein E5288_WYG012059 [Bos mutus]|uniref:Uncharacterized protein n=1 Tax=Bos mutus TaxID=72004 RepID=A0A6B0R8E0_9CETA|nr:hypothetical protein [Bos mutus]